MQTIKERDIQKGILDYLALKGVAAFRVNSGTAAQTDQGRSYFMRLAPKGTADIIGCLPNGKFLAIEVKTPTGTVSPEQREYLASIELRGGVAFVARSIDDVVKRLSVDNSV